MTIMYYPSKTNPMGYRVQDKVLNVQKYFPFSKYSPEKAKKLAEKTQQALQEKRQIRNARLNLDINRLFNEDGSIKGIRRGIKKRAYGLIEVFYVQARINGKQLSTDIKITGRSFHQAYQLAQRKLLAMHKLDMTEEIRQQFKDCAYLYKTSLLKQLN